MREVGKAHDPNPRDSYDLLEDPRDIDDGLQGLGEQGDIKGPVWNGGEAVIEICVDDVVAS